MHEQHHDDQTSPAGPAPADAAEPDSGATEPERVHAAPRDPDAIADELLRRRYAVGRRAAIRTGVAAAAFALLAVVAGIGLQQAYATTPPPVPRPGTVGTPGATSSLAASPDPAATSTGPATAEGGPPATLDAAGVIHRPDGPPVRIPLRAGTSAVHAARAAGGWLIRTVTGDPLAMQVTVFLGDDGRLRDFAPRLAGAHTAVRADGRAMAAYVHPHLYVYDLPSGRELTRLDVRTAARGNQVHDMWLTADRLLVGWAVLEGAHRGAVTGLVAYDLATGTATVTEDLLVADVAGDGTALLLDGASCIRVGRLAATGPRAQAPACLPGRTVLRAALSPDGSLVALTLGTRDVPAREGRLAVFRTADLAAGRVRELAGQAGRLLVVGWSGPARLLALDDGREPLDGVLTCTAAGCDMMPLAGAPVAVVPAHLP